MSIGCARSAAVSGSTPDVTSLTHDACAELVAGHESRRMVGVGGWKLACESLEGTHQYHYTTTHPSSSVADHALQHLRPSPSSWLDFAHPTLQTHRDPNAGQMPQNETKAYAGNRDTPPP